jgi:DNA-binding MarR family transcriptional regulator
MAVSFPPQTASLATELRVVLASLSRRLREQSHPGDFTSSQKSVILRLERDGPATTSALARAESVKPQSMGTTVASLEALGIISGSPHPSDGRQTIFALTDRCRQILQTTRAAKEDWLLRALQSTLTPAEQEQLAATLPLLERLSTA